MSAKDFSELNKKMMKFETLTTQNFNIAWELKLVNLEK